MCPKRNLRKEKASYFDGGFWQLFGTWLLCMLLSIGTLGIYTWWIPIKIKKWQIKHTHLLENDTPAEEQENICLTDKEIIEEKKSKAKKIKWFYFGAAVF